jgi:hypothetical protein
MGAVVLACILLLKALSGKNYTPTGDRTRDLPLRRRMPFHWAIGATFFGKGVVDDDVSKTTSR